MVYRYRITLAGIKGFFRVYAVNARNSLYTFHKQLCSDLEFQLDQPVLFKALDGDGAVIARYALVDIGYGTIDDITFADAVKAGAASFQYFYDVRSRKSVIVTLEGQDTGDAVQQPVLLESKTAMWRSKTFPPRSAGCPGPAAVMMTTKTTWTTTGRTGTSAKKRSSCMTKMKTALERSSCFFDI